MVIPVSCRPAYEKLLKVLQEQSIPTAHFQLGDQHPHRTPPAPPKHPQRTPTGPPQHPSAGLHQQPYTVHGRPPTAPPHRTTHTPHGPPQQQHGVAPEGGGQGGAAPRASSAAPVVKTEERDQGPVSRQQVYAHDVPFHTITSLQRVSLLFLFYKK